jgi:hypothetical protein
VNEHASQADVAGAFERIYRDEASRAARVQMRLREARQAASAGSPRPIRYDESGFPIAKRASLTARIRRLLTG